MWCGRAALNVVGGSLSNSSMSGRHTPSSGPARAISSAARLVGAHAKTVTPRSADCWMTRSRSARLPPDSRAGADVHDDGFIDSRYLGRELQGPGRNAVKLIVDIQPAECLPFHNHAYSSRPS